VSFRLSEQIGIDSAWKEAARSGFEVELNARRVVAVAKERPFRVGDRLDLYVATLSEVHLCFFANRLNFLAGLADACRDFTHL